MELARNFLRQAQQGQIPRRETYGEVLVGSDLVVGEIPYRAREFANISEEPICLLPVVPLVVVRTGTFVDVPTQGIFFSYKLKIGPDGVENKRLSQCSSKQQSSLAL